MQGLGFGFKLYGNVGGSGVAYKIVITKLVSKFWSSKFLFFFLKMTRQKLL